MKDWSGPTFLPFFFHFLYLHTQFSGHHWGTAHGSWRNLKQPNNQRENKLLMQYSCIRHLCTGKHLQFPSGVTNYNVWFIKNDNRVHRACILVINCNAFLISCCYLYFCLYATDYTVHLHHSASNRRDTKGMFTWCNGADMPELAVTQAACCHSTELRRTRDATLGLRATRKWHQALSSASQKDLLDSMNSCGDMVYQLSVPEMSPIGKQSQAARGRDFSGAPFEYWCLNLCIYIYIYIKDIRFQDPEAKSWF